MAGWTGTNEKIVKKRLFGCYGPSGEHAERLQVVLAQDTTPAVFR